MTRASIQSSGIPGYQAADAAERYCHASHGAGEVTPSVCDPEADLRLDWLAGKLGVKSDQGAGPAPANPSGQFRLDPAHGAAPAHYSQSERIRPATRRPPHQTGWLTSISWTCLALGMMAFGCGGSLLAWGLWNERPELWMLGLPTGLVGQLLLLLGLVLQLDHLRHDTNAARAKLHEVDRRLRHTGQLRRKRSQLQPEAAFRNDPPEGTVPSPRADFSSLWFESADMSELPES